MTEKRKMLRSTALNYLYKYIFSLLTIDSLSEWCSKVDIIGSIVKVFFISFGTFILIG